jgi:hypothetical protein
MSDLNLLPSRAKFQANQIRLKRLAAQYMIFLGVIWVVIVLITAVIWVGGQSMLRTAEGKCINSMNQYKEMTEEVVVNQRLKYQAKIVDEVLLNRFEYGETLKRLNSIFPPEVALDDFDLEKTKNISLAGKVIGNTGADVIEQKINEINSKQVTGFLSAKLTSLKLNNGVWSFTVEVEIDEKTK